MLRLTSILAFASTTFALTFTSPFAGSTVDLTSSLSITWIPGPSDPATFTLEIINTNAGSSADPQILATNVPTSKGSYTVPANTIDNYGDGFELYATGAQGEAIGSSGTFGLADGGVYSLQTASNGVLTIVTSATQQESAPTSTSSVVDFSGTTSSQQSAGSPVTTGSPRPTSSSPESKTSSAGPRTSSSSSSSSSVSASSTSSQSRTSSSGAAATSSGSSDSSSNLGFNSAADVVRGRTVVACAAFMGALALVA